MRFADELTVLVAQAADDLGERLGTPQGRVLALNLKASAANNSMIIASGPSPTANLLDMVVLVTLGRMVSEDYWVPRYGTAAEGLLDASRKLETEIWSVAAQVLTPAQQDELRAMIRAWRAANPGQTEVGLRFRDFSEIAAGKARGAKGQPSSLFGMLFLDPFAGLDPATREMEQTRYLANRAMYVLKRMPNLLRWQSELFFAQTLATPEIQQVLSNSTRFVESAQQLSQAAQQLPAQLSAESQKLMNDFTQQAPQWQALLSQLQQTLQAGNEMAASVNAATKSLDTFVGRYAPPQSTEEGATPPSPPAAVGGGEPKPVATAEPSSSGKHFDVNDYGTAAAQIANAAQQLNLVIASLEKSTPQINAVVERTGLQGKELVDYTWHKALWFLALALTGFVLAMLAYRWLAARWFGKTTEKP